MSSNSAASFHTDAVKNIELSKQVDSETFIKTTASPPHINKVKQYVACCPLRTVYLVYSVMKTKRISRFQVRLKKRVRPRLHIFYDQLQMTVTDTENTTTYVYLGSS